MIDPLFVAPPRTQPPRHRLLLISYIFPPDRSVGGLRWQKMLPYLAMRGWEADVITLEPARGDSVTGLASHPALTELPPGTRVFGVPGAQLPTRRLERAALAAVRLARRLRRHRPTISAATTTADSSPPAAAPPPDKAIPADQLRWSLSTPRGWARAYFGWTEHAEIGAWSRRAAALGNALQATRPYDVVVTSGPPHMTHEAGRLVSMATGIPFVPDFRDPWSLSERVYTTWASPLWMRLARHYEARVVARAAVVVANTEPFAARLRARYPTGPSVLPITNGADEDPLPPSRHMTRFSIRYAGTIYTDSDPIALFRAADIVIRDLGLRPDEFGVDMIGEFADNGGARILDLAAAAGVRSYTTVGAHQPRRAALDFLAGATMFVTFPGVNAMLTIPAKVFECMRYDAWLLVLAPLGSAAELALAGTAADVVPLDDVPEIAKRIAARVQSHRRGERPMALAQDPRFTRRFQADRLANALESLPERAAG